MSRYPQFKNTEVLFSDDVSQEMVDSLLHTFPIAKVFYAKNKGGAYHLLNPVREIHIISMKGGLGALVYMDKTTCYLYALGDNARVATFILSDLLEEHLIPLEEYRYTLTYNEFYARANDLIPYNPYP